MLQINIIHFIIKLIGLTKMSEKKVGYIRASSFDQNPER